MTTCWISDRQGKGDQRQSIGNGTRFQQAVCSTSSSSSAVAHAAGTADQTCRRHRQHPSLQGSQGISKPAYDALSKYQVLA